MNTARFVAHSGRAIVFATGLSALSAPVGAATCDSVCGQSEPCVINSLVTVDPGDVFDCTGYTTVEIREFGKVRVEDGFFTFLANNLKLIGAGQIEAKEVTADTSVGVTIETTGDLQIWGKVRSDNNGGGGAITIDADGDINIYESGQEGIEASGTSSGGDGGEITVRSDGNIWIYDPIRATGASAGVTYGGRITFDAGGDIVTGLDGKILATGRKGQGGSISLTAGGDVQVGAKLDAYGNLDGAHGGEIELTAGDAVVVNDTLSVRGGVNVSGGNAFGGSVQIDSGCGGAQINADIDMRGGEGAGLAGGALLIESIGDVSVASGVEILSEATATGGFGGDVAISSESDVTLNDNVVIDASGDLGDPSGFGAAIEITGCRVYLGSAVNIDVTGYDGGTIEIAAADEPGDPPLPAGQSQPLVIPETTTLQVIGNASGADGEVSLIVSELEPGACSNDNTLECTLDTDCGVGCGSGECEDANPDTDGVLSQFDVGADSVDDGTLDGCDAQCP